MALIRTSGPAGAKAAYGVVDLSDTNTSKVTLGWKPKFIYVRWGADATSFTKVETYDDSISTGNTYMGSDGTAHAIPNSSSNYINSVDSDGFTLGTYASTVRKAVYCAYG